MYSYEIKQFLFERNNILTLEEYLMITDVNRNPQIRKMKYNSRDDTYEMSTSDGYFFKFKVKGKRSEDES